ILDPEYAATISEKDRHKIIRALEIITLSAQKVSDFPKSEAPRHQEYDFRCWFLYYPRETLFARIDRRGDEMLRRGFLNEVRELDKQGLRQNSPASRAIGYRQALEYLDSARSEADLIAFTSRFKQATRKFAKRQFTWFRKEPSFRWLNINEHPKERLKE